MSRRYIDFVPKKRAAGMEGASIVLPENAARQRVNGSVLGGGAMLGGGRGAVVDGFVRRKPVERRVEDFEVEDVFDGEPETEYDEYADYQPAVKPEVRQVQDYSRMFVRKDVAKRPLGGAKPAAGGAFSQFGKEDTRTQGLGVISDAPMGGNVRGFEDVADDTVEPTVSAKKLKAKKIATTPSEVMGNGLVEGAKKRKFSGLLRRKSKEGMNTKGATDEMLETAVRDAGALDGELKIPPQARFVHTERVMKRPLSKTVYSKKVETPKEEPRGPVTIINTPEKDSRAGLIVTIIITIILGAAAGTVAFLLLPK